MNVFTSVDLSIFTENNGVSLSTDGDLGSSRGREASPLTIVLVVDLTILACETD